MSIATFFWSEIYNIFVKFFLILSVETLRMPSEAAKKRQAKKKAAAQSRGKPKTAVNSSDVAIENGDSSTSNGGLLDVSSRACTGVLASHPLSKDLKIENFSITFHGVELLKDTKLELNSGRRYGFIGSNGCGESSY